MSTIEWYAHAMQCASPLSGLDLSGIFQTYLFVSPKWNKYKLILEVFCVLTYKRSSQNRCYLYSWYLSWTSSSQLLHWPAYCYFPSANPWLFLPTLFFFGGCTVQFTILNKNNCIFCKDHRGTSEITASIKLCSPYVAKSVSFYERCSHTASTNYWSAKG